MTDPDSYTVLCARVQENPNPVAGSRISGCARCGAAVWIAPTTDMITTGAFLEPVCAGCVTHDEERKFNRHIAHGPLPGQVDELIEDLLRRRLTGD